MTEKTLDWLNQNRYRAYPLMNDERLVTGDVRLPNCILLDCKVMDTRPRPDGSIPHLYLTKVVISKDHTDITLEYDGAEYTLTIEGDGDIEKIIGTSKYVYMSFTTSSHTKILEFCGEGEWNLKAEVLRSKVICVDASGVSGITCNGNGEISADTATGVIRLVDGYRTQPVIKSGKVLVKVGNQYGLNPCRMKGWKTYDTEGCDNLMMFFCGQNAINTGNVVLQGGPGVVVNQGTYTVKKEIGELKAGDSIPCINVSTTSEVLKIYRPSTPEGSNEGATDDTDDTDDTDQSAEV